MLTSEDARGSDPNMPATSDPYYLGSSAGLPDSYGQVVPPREELLVHHAASLLLPPQLRLLLPHHHNDATTMPLMVQMHHVFCHLDPEVRIFAMAQRYREKSVTQLFYKCARPPDRSNGSPLGSLAGAISGSPSMLSSSESAVERRSSELRQNSRDVRLQSVRISSTRRQREDGTGQEYTSYLIDSVLSVHGVQTTLRSERRYKHFNLLDELLRKDFTTLVPQALPAKRPFGNLHPGFVEERRVGLEKYLQQCMRVPELASSSVFCHFVEADAAGAEFDLQHSLKRVCQRQGYLLKRGRKVCSWKRRYFCICGGVLYYYYTAEIANPFQPLGVVTLQPNDPAPKPDGGSDDMLVGSALLSSVTVEPDPAAASLHGKHVFAIHTPQRTWILAADTAHDRSEWIRVLCEGGSQFSATGMAESASPPPTPRGVSGSGSSAKMRDSDFSEADGGGPDEAVVGADGTLWKRASKVHVTQASEATTGKARGWVTRHFRLLDDHGLVVYLQNADDSINAARGVVQLSNFTRVEDAAPPDDPPPDGGALHAFQLVASDTTSEHAAAEPLILAASSAADKAAWMERLTAALAKAPPLASDGEASIETQLAAASISG